MSHLSRTWLLSLSLSALFLAGGCKQQEGELCDATEDCEEGLVCDCPAVQDGVVVRRGVCEVRASGTCPPIPQPERDAGPQPDASLPEAGVDDGGADDAGSDDAGPVDAGTDAGPSDAGTDAGSSDAGTDAGPADSGVADAG